MLRILLFFRFSDWSGKASDCFQSHPKILWFLDLCKGEHFDYL